MNQQFILFRVIKRYVLCILYVIFLASICNVISLVVPLSFMSIIDRVLVSSGYSTLYLITLLLALSAVVEFFVGYYKKYLYNWFSSRVICEFSGLFFERLFLLKYSFFKKESVASHITRVGELYKIKNFISSWLISYLIDFLFLCIYLIVMFYISSGLTFLILSSVPFHILQYFYFGSRIRKSDTEFYEKNIDLNKVMIDSIKNVDLIKISNIEKEAARKVSSTLGRSLESGFRLSNYQAYSEELSNLFSKLSETLLVFFGAYLALNGSITLGELVAFLLLKDRVTLPLIRLASIWEEYCQFNLSVNRVDAIFKQELEIKDGETVTSIESLELVDVEVRYSDKLVISNASFYITKGDVISFCGESGAGKSTLIKLIPRITDYQSGTISINGTNIKILDVSYLRSRISYLNQSFNLVNGSIKDNILWGSKGLNDEKLEEVLELCCCIDFINKLDDGLDTEVNEEGGALSGGQKQRIALARAMISDFDILILDEPTSALDSVTEMKLIRNIVNYCKDKIVLIVSHKETVHSYCDKTFELIDGKLIEQGKHINTEGMTHAMQL